MANGSGESAAVAKEHRFDVDGLEIRPKYAEMPPRLLNIPIQAAERCHCDPTDRKFEVVCMGDVPEHLSGPVESMLTGGGVRWVSTPNFKSAARMILGHNESRWNVCELLNDFSLQSLQKLLLRFDLKVADCWVTPRYYGSLEVAAVKKRSVQPHNRAREPPGTGNYLSLNELAVGKQAAGITG